MVHPSAYDSVPERARVRVTSADTSAVSDTGEQGTIAAVENSAAVPPEECTEAQESSIGAGATLAEAAATALPEDDTTEVASTTRDAGPDAHLALHEIEGMYECHVHEGTNEKNDAHYVEVAVSTPENMVLSWTNRAGISWELSVPPDFPEASPIAFLKVGDDCPHIETFTKCEIIRRKDDGDIIGLLGPEGEIYQREGELEPADPPVCPSTGHPMVISSFNENGYEGGYICNRCGDRFGRSSYDDSHRSMRRWLCQQCTDDYCFKCHPEFKLPYTAAAAERRRQEEAEAAERRRKEEAEAAERRCIETRKFVDSVLTKIEADEITWDPIHVGSFGLSSVGEARLCLLSITEEVGFDLTPDDHGDLRRERGVRIPLQRGDTVTHADFFGTAVGTVVSQWINGDNSEQVEIEFDVDEDFDGEEKSRNYREEPGVFYDEDESPFPFRIEGLVRRLPDEVWLRQDTASCCHAKTDVVVNTAVKAEGGAQPHMDTVPARVEGVANASDGSAATPCCICLESVPNVLSGLCRRASPAPSSSAPCDAAFCSDCFSQHCEMIISGSRYSAAPVRCPGAGCGLRLPMEVWHRHVSAIGLLQYTHAPRQLLSIRCPSCDRVTDLFPRAAMGREGRLAVYERVFNLLTTNRESNMMKLAQVWHRFSLGEETPQDTIENFKDIINKETCSGDDPLMDILMGGLEGEGGLLSLVVDVERRAALSLSLLRTDPFVQLKCCDSPVCFKCKVDGHHEGQTCEERQMEEMDIEAQFCPQCGVATVRSDGCRHIVCVCGAHWEWEGEVDY